MKMVEYKDVRLINPAISDLKPKYWYDSRPGVSQNLVTLLGTTTMTILQNDASTNELYFRLCVTSVQ